jgi:antibiotic biosynthesis monooxygenase (ABM) superfamily enzyme
LANKISFIVTTKCQAKDEVKFNKWYTEVHIPMLMKYKGLKAVTRFKSAGEPCRYTAVYEFASMQDLKGFETSPELAAAQKEMQGTWTNCVELVSREAFEFIKEW